MRDLGGHPTEDGGETRFGAVVRADSVRQLSDEGWQALVDHGVRTVIALRGDHERAEDPPADVPVEVVHVPFMEASAAEWEEISLEQATEMIAERIIRTREQTWEEETDDGQPLKRTLGMHFLGGATLDSEENYLIKKFFTAAGAVSIENQARI